jgi:hypothetical protein
MAQATTTTEGEIVLSGDLTGDGNSPQLRASGVTPGSYTPVQRMYVDSKGRITSIGAMTPAEVSAAVGDATTTTKGVVQAGVGINVSGGSISIPNATSNSLGVFTINPGPGVVLTNGVVTFDASQRIATDAQFGYVRIGNNIVNSLGVLSLPLATNSVKGVASFSTGTSVTGGVVTVDTASVAAALPVATTTTLGVVATGTAATTNIVVDGSGTISVPLATNSVKGVASFSTGFSISGGVVTINSADVAALMPVATTTTVGRVRTGTASSTNIVIGSGTIWVPVATTTTLGVVATGTAATTNIAVDGAGTISVPLATNSVKGVASFSTGLSITTGVVTTDINAIAAAMPPANSHTEALGLVYAPYFGEGGSMAGYVSVNGLGEITAAVASAAQAGVVAPASSDFTLSGADLTVRQKVATGGYEAPGPVWTPETIPLFNFVQTNEQYVFQASTLPANFNPLAYSRVKIVLDDYIDISSPRIDINVDSKIKFTELVVEFAGGELHFEGSATGGTWFSLNGENYAWGAGGPITGAAGSTEVLRLIATPWYDLFFHRYIYIIRSGNFI